MPTQSLALRSTNKVDNETAAQMRKGRHDCTRDDPGMVGVESEFVTRVMVSLEIQDLC